ncbi:MAG: HypC/HybG/HupF family hydrogenase formation chaperone [Thermodesulfobacteriota bacterium]|jgi:hydrogenase expression/formation protein HypC
MCVAIPSKIISIEGLLAMVEVYGARRQVNLMLLPEEAEIGEYVLVHAGFAIQKVDVEAGKESLKLFDEVLKKLGGDPDNA